MTLASRVDPGGEAAPRVVIVGGGPAGLTAALMLVRRGARPVVLEKAELVGGLARTEVYKGYRFDIGGHRFYTKLDEVDRLWHEILGPEFRKVRRLSRIHYRGKFFRYPLDVKDTLRTVGLVESAAMGFSYLSAKLRPVRDERTFEQWVTNRFGRRLYKRFFKAYTEKVWGIPCSEIRAEWAAQRIRGLSLKSAVSNALFGTNGVKSLVEEFDYPALGPGSMWEACRDEVERGGGSVVLGADVVGLERDGDRVRAIVARVDGQTRTFEGDAFLSSAALPDLVTMMTPEASEGVRDAARGLAFRDLIVVGLIVRHPDPFPDNWIYVHTEDKRVGRIQNFRNWSPDLVPDAEMTSLGMEYFCNEGDDLWSMSDDELIAVARRELDELGLVPEEHVEDGVVIRQQKAYPVYDATYRAHVETIRRFLDGIENLQTIGRNGLHRYNNQDHSMLTAMLAVDNIYGASHDLWEVNTERSYYEEFQAKP